MKINSISYCTLALISCASFVFADEEKNTNLLRFDGVPTSSAKQDSIQATAQVKRLSLFKNGYGFYRLTVPLPKEPVLMIENLPKAVHGTFWMEGTTAKSLSYIVSRLQKKEIVKDNYTLLELAAANPGTSVQLKLSSNPSSMYEGTIMSLTPPKRRLKKIYPMNMPYHYWLLKQKIHPYIQGRQG